MSLLSFLVTQPLCSHKPSNKTMNKSVCGKVMKTSQELILECQKSSTQKTEATVWEYACCKQVYETNATVNVRRLTLHLSFERIYFQHTSSCYSCCDFLSGSSCYRGCLLVYTHSASFGITMNLKRRGKALVNINIWKSTSQIEDYLVYSMCVNWQYFIGWWLFKFCECASFR